MKKSKAFTLVELLVVISIIALLLGILLPALGRARDMGRRIACGNQLKTLALANEAYANTHNYDYVPIVYIRIEGPDKPYPPQYWLTNSDFRAILNIDSYKTSEDDDDSGFDVPEEFLCPSDKISKNPHNI